jgi:hypothetical protein
VRINYKKNISRLIDRKTILFFFSLFFSMLSKAQHDTTLLADSLPPLVEEVPAEEQPSSGVTTEDKTSNYFLKKSQSPGDSFIVQRNVPDSVVKKMQQDDDFWYANADIKKEQPPPQKKLSYTPLGQRQWFQTLLWLIIIGGFAAFIMWYLSGTNVGLFRKKNKIISQTDDDELITEDIFAINYQKEIDKAAAQGNHRLAIRLMFLRVLKNMSEKNIIQYKQDRTNLDYLLQLYPTNYYNNFFRITRNYEYSWYGQFQVNEEAYKIIRNDFDQIDRQLQ